MEKRLDVLKYRQAKRLSRNRHSAWADCQIVINATCRSCKFKFDFGSFVKHAELTGNGHIRRLCCPECQERLIGVWEKGF